jgi:hypothetical protein
VQEGNERAKCWAGGSVGGLVAPVDAAHHALDISNEAGTDGQDAGPDKGEASAGDGCS